MGPLFSPQRSPKEGFTGVESAETALSPLKVLQLYAKMSTLIFPTVSLISNPRMNLNSIILVFGLS